MTWQPYKESAFVHFKRDECRVVLVLGAGASAHLGFPSGADLCARIISNTRNPQSEPYKGLLYMDFLDKDITAFHESIEKSFPHSIDEFLSDRPEFIEIGRAAIAQILIGCEDEKRLRERERNWYGLLRDRIKAEVLKNQFSPVIVTFNYDLSLDKFLYDFFSSTFSQYAKLKTLEEAIRIFHVHGRLGHLDYEDSQWCRSYGKSISPIELRKASQGIRVVSELDNDFGRDMVFAQKAIDEAEKVIFLGFGYDDLNLDRLRVSSWKIGKFFGTALNLDRERREQLLQKTQKRITLAKSDVEVYDYLQTAECWNY